MYACMCLSMIACTHAWVNVCMQFCVYLIATAHSAGPGLWDEDCVLYVVAWWIYADIPQFVAIFVRSRGCIREILEVRGRKLGSCFATWSNLGMFNVKPWTLNLKPPTPSCSQCQFLLIKTSACFKCLKMQCWSDIEFSCNAEMQTSLSPYACAAKSLPCL